ncbi:MAG: CsbD family protein [Xanthomonadales bacterium]|nr:CsbD family protein [Xanthomonadales bacterium]MCB1627244.1 CsbD family protein [Xanthomonadales bacterium]MCB1635161.1 CsbD family protein [Xanthomonadales bacterium]
MNSDIIKGKWKQIRGRVKEQWGELTDDDLDVAEGHRDYLVGKIQERYGVARDKAAEKVREFEASL